MIRIVPVIVSFLLLAAHFLRESNLVMLGICCGIPWVLLIKDRRSLLIAQIAIYAGVLVWVNTTLRIYRQRVLLGLPWQRAILILGGVTVLTAIAGMLLHSPTLKARYPVRKSEE